MLSPDAPALALGKRLLNHALYVGSVHLILLRDGVCDDHAALQACLPLDAQHPCRLLRVVDAAVHGVSAVPGVKGGEPVGPKAQHGDAEGLKVFQRQPDIENGLCAGAHYGHRRFCQLLQVGRDVKALRRAPVDAADAAGCKQRDAGHGGTNHGGCHGSGPVAPHGQQHGQVPARGLGDVLCLPQEHQLLLRKAHLDFSVEHGNGGGQGSVGADGGLTGARRLHIFRVGHAVGDDGRLQRHNRLPVFEGGRHLRRHVQTA